MKQSKSPKSTHLGLPNTTVNIDHTAELVKTNNCHGYEIRCKECNKHIKWATLEEQVWFELNNNTVTFRKLFWAPRYDEQYQTVVIAADQYRRELGEAQ